MFSLGPWEMAIVGIVAVLLFGKKLPEVMRGLGKSYSEFRKGLAEMQSSVHYSDYGSSSSYSGSSSSSSYSSGSKSHDFDDYDEPTAPRFEPPPPAASETSSGDTAPPENKS